MIASIVASLRQNPELAVFLTLALGFLLGRVRFGTFKLGNVVGTLLAGVLIGQLDIEVHPLVKVVFFDLFLFATGAAAGLMAGSSHTRLSSATLAAPRFS